jgi:hypothetical protein
MKAREPASVTAYSEINAVLDPLLAHVQAAIGEQLIGMYLHGSLAAGGFEPGRSDIDVLAVTEGELNHRALSALEVAHARVQATGQTWATRLEVSYIPRVALRRHQPHNVRHPALRMDGSFGIDVHGSDWVLQRHVIRECGIALVGPDPRTLIEPVSPREIRWAARETLHEWWAPQLEDPTRLRSAEYQAYAVLTMCRALYSLQHGDVAPKATAARWAQQRLGQPASREGASRSGLIARALAWRHGAWLDALDEVLALIRYTLAYADAATLQA